MLSNEEKKAYDNLIMLKYFTMEKEDKQAIDTILNLIEKQSKEIEGLKDKNKELKDKNKELEDTLKQTQNSWYEDTKKQSKEIEELKNITKSYDSFLGTEKIVIADKKFFVNGYFRENYVSKDEIKAKIEEIDNILKNNRLIDKLKNYFEAQKEVLQSLLEKE